MLRKSTHISVLSYFMISHDMYIYNAYLKVIWLCIRLTNHQTFLFTFVNNYVFAFTEPDIV